MDDKILFASSWTNNLLFISSGIIFLRDRTKYLKRTSNKDMVQISVVHEVFIKNYI